MDQHSRRIIGFGIHPGDVDGVAACRMFNNAISGTGPPAVLAATTILFSDFIGGAQI